MKSLLTTMTAEKARATPRNLVAPVAAESSALAQEAYRPLSDGPPSWVVGNSRCPSPTPEATIRPLPSYLIKTKPSSRRPLAALRARDAGRTNTTRFAV